MEKSQARIVMLDYTEEYLDLKKDDTGKILYGRVCDFLRIEEKDYFGLMFINQDKIRVNLEGNSIIREFKENCLVLA